MIAHDAVFLALALAVSGRRPRWWPALALLPICAWGSTMLPSPADALLPLCLAAAVGLRAPRLLPVAAILAAVESPGLPSAAAACLVWLGSFAVLPILIAKVSRFGPERMRGTPLLLFSIAALYFATAPLFPS